MTTPMPSVIAHRRAQESVVEKIFSIGERTGIGLKSQAETSNQIETHEDPRSSILETSVGRSARRPRLVSKVASVAFSLVSPREPPPPPAFF